MQTASATKLTVKTNVQAPVSKVWEYYTVPKHITQWNAASDDWHSPFAENDLRAGGKFLYRMEAKDKSFGFDFGGVFDVVEPNKRIEYTMGDGRRAVVEFIEKGDQTEVLTTFDAEQTHSLEMQQGGWQAILDNFRKYVETN